MATDVLGTLQRYLDALQAAGIRATDDPRDLNPPALLIRPPVLHFRFGRGCQSADWTARLVLSNSGTRQALQEALPLIERIQEALQGAVVTATPADWELPDGGGPTPGYQLTWTEN
jgi:hypothetical protein